jgi:nucleoside-diphosphate-sugar epimerase
MKVLITGGSGFIGTNLIETLLGAGHDVAVFDKQQSTRFPEFCIIGDVRDRKALEGSLVEVDVVYHLAAEHADDVRPVSLYYDVNVGGAENLVAAAVKNNVQRIVFTSTVALYGLNAGIPNEESPANPFNHYGRSKYEAERVFRDWASKDQERVAVFVRPAVIFGERNRGNVFNLLNQIVSGKFIMIGNGKNKKSMGYVLNIAQFLTEIIDCSPGVHVYNYADKPDMTTEELITVALKTLGRNNTVPRIPYCTGLIGGYLFDLLSKLTGRTFPVSSIRIKKFCTDTRVSTCKMRESGFKPLYSLTQGLERMIRAEFSTELLQNELNWPISRSREVRGGMDTRQMRL